MEHTIFTLLIQAHVDSYTTSTMTLLLNNTYPDLQKGFVGRDENKLSFFIYDLNKSFCI